MAEISGITVYPLTGARGNELESVCMDKIGIEGDRDYVLYDPETHERLSQKQIPSLAQFGVVRDYSSPHGWSPMLEGVPDIVSHFTDDKAIEFRVYPRDAEMCPDVTVSEFGDLVECRDISASEVDLTAYLSEVAGRPVRLALKKENLNYGPDLFANPPVPVSLRKNAAIHIISEASVGSIDLGDLRPADLAKRFRANLVISGVEPFEEANWPGKVLKVGGGIVSIVIERLAERCSVPGHDQQTGENMKDVPRAYRSFPRAESGKPSFGVYGYPIISKCWMSGTVRVGDAVGLE